MTIEKAVGVFTTSVLLGLVLGMAIWLGGMLIRWVFGKVKGRGWRSRRRAHRVMDCTRCGAKMRSGARYCPNCGKQVVWMHVS